MQWLLSNVTVFISLLINTERKWKTLTGLNGAREEDSSQLWCFHLPTQPTWSFLCVRKKIAPVRQRWQGYHPPMVTPSQKLLCNRNDKLTSYDRRLGTFLWSLEMVQKAFFRDRDRSFLSKEGKRVLGRRNHPLPSMLASAISSHEVDFFSSCLQKSLRFAMWCYLPRTLHLCLRKINTQPICRLYLP